MSLHSEAWVTLWPWALTVALVAFAVGLATAQCMMAGGKRRVKR